MIKNDASSFVWDYSAMEIIVTAPTTKAMIRWYPALYVGMAEEPDKPPAAVTAPLRKFAGQLDWTAV